VPVGRNALAVRFHLELLKIVRQQGETFVIGKDRASGTREPVCRQREGRAHHHVFFKRSFEEMAVDCSTTFEKRCKPFKPRASATGKPIEDHSE
jgi:hypothetical protein